jgi:hypothetical protein
MGILDNGFHEEELLLFRDMQTPKGKSAKLNEHVFEAITTKLAPKFELELLPDAPRWDYHLIPFFGKLAAGEDLIRTKVFYSTSLGDLAVTSSLYCWNFFELVHQWNYDKRHGSDMLNYLCGVCLLKNVRDLPYTQLLSVPQFVESGGSFIKVYLMHGKRPST